MEKAAFCLFSLLLINTRTSMAAVAIGLALVSQEHPHSCMEEGGSGVAHPVGTAWSLPDTCGQSECIQRQDTLYITYQSCGYAEAEPPCYIVYNTSAEYPACCGKVVCDPVEGNEIDVDDYGHYDEYMMSTYDAPNFLPAENSQKSDSEAKKEGQAGKQNTTKVAQLIHPAAPVDSPAGKEKLPASGDQLFSIILPNTYYSSATHSVSGEGGNYTKTREEGEGPVIDYEIELPAPMKSPTVFDYHEISLDDYDWDRIFGEAASQ